jgi:rhamnose transport system ATP-binding protein
MVIPMGEQVPLVKAVGLYKAFEGVDVLKNASLDLLPGEIHALVGENGAGKSTLARIIGGVHTPRAGTVQVNGRTVHFHRPCDAIAQGIALIHQEPLTFPDLSVAENIFIGRQPRRHGRIDWNAVHREAAEILESLGVKIDPRAKVRGLSIADQQMVEMASALSQHAKILLMDETTAALTPSEVERLFGILRQLRDRGAALAFIGHRLEEIFEICDRITVLRDGEIVGQRLTKETSIDEILRLMVGRPLAALFAKDVKHAIGSIALETRRLTCAGQFSDITLQVRAGEVVGLAGLVGAGRTEVARAIFGIEKIDAGEIRIGGQAVQVAGPRGAMKKGLALVPEERQRHGLLMPMSVWQNTTLAIVDRLARFGWRRDAMARDVARIGVKRLDVKLRGIDQPIRELSGGNQQKVVLSKWLATKPKVMLLDEPTRGIDISAKAEVHRLVSELAAEGMAVLMISSDLLEVLAMSDRILVMREGRIVAEFPREEATAERVIAAATGQVLRE